MPTKNKRYILKKLSNKEYVDFSKAEIERMANREMPLVDMTMNQTLLEALESRKEYLTNIPNFNYQYYYNRLLEFEITQEESNYLIQLLLEGD